MVWSLERRLEEVKAVGHGLGTGLGGPGGGAGDQADVLLEAPEHDKLCLTEHQSVLLGGRVGGEEGGAY